MLNFLPIILFFYAHGSAYYSSIPAYSIILTCFPTMLTKTLWWTQLWTLLIVLNHNKSLYLVSQRWFLPIRKEFDKTDKNLSDTADNGWSRSTFFACTGPYVWTFCQTMWYKLSQTLTTPKPHLKICNLRPIILELCSVLVPLKSLPIILKLWQHNWSKPREHMEYDLCQKA